MTILLSVLIANIKYVLFSHKRKMNFPLMKIGNDRINEIDDTIVLGVYLDKS